MSKINPFSRKELAKRLKRAVKETAQNNDDGWWDRYREYLASPAWKELRAQALARDGHACRICAATKRLQAHHRRYPPDVTLTVLDDLTTLCYTCHTLFTNHARMRRKNRRRG